ncbi:uncharacterized protein OCT59_000211 [Rhizophagus irregularis]|uniref:F-box domain-containing protein n=2 Tax=Rhizophagus irregularis TaxID=588596 RepID=A0A015L663_RHIIW|nr:hypothetical protein RirG_108810 [Rhizophagus irregularis DAOM 197198w]UZN98928.1 hypothetical protein OCT59_000211 [Rhizophagus irregularis]
MSCSKIFSEDLPELIYGILKYFQNDYSTLHSCILVNRLWCRSAIPLLWENPFSIPIKNYNFIIIYSHNSNSDFKTKLIEYKIINNNSLPPNTLFNYPSFLKYLRINNKFIYSVRNWVGNAIRTSNPGNLSLLSDFERKVDIFVSLFKIFIENEIKLHTFEIEFSRIACVYTYLNNILELILQNTNFIHNIRNINLFVGSNSSGIIPNANKKYKLIKNNLSQIINLQQNLKKILIYNGSFPLYRPLLLSKDSNCSNTLNTITFYKINLDCLSKNIFEQLNVLESIHFLYCYSLGNNFIQQINNLAKPFKLKSLFIEGELQQFETMELLQKSGKYLENFGIVLDIYGLICSLYEQILVLITKYCKNIKFFDFRGPVSLSTYQILNLVENIQQNLNYLTIDVWYDNTGSNSSTILLHLGYYLPSKLEYLCFDLHYIKASWFEEFLRQSQHTFIKKLLINSSEGQDILPFIKEYIMKKKRVKYLAISDSSREDTFDRYSHNVKEICSMKYNEVNNVKELFSLKYEVDEFRLYNIEVQSYLSLKINSYNYIKEIN